MKERRNLLPKVDFACPTRQAWLLYLLDHEKLKEQLSESSGPSVIRDEHPCFGGKGIDSLCLSFFGSW